jgi:5'-nucleotidase
MADSKPLAGKRILIGNDDGIHAPGLKALEEVAHSLSDDVWTVAPEVEQSATSHSLTTRRPLRLRRFGERRFAVDGTPTDCVVVAVNHVLRDHRPDLVLSGFNHGGNLGEDVGYSGTVAVAMEAALFGIPAIAMSQQREHEQPVDFSPAKAFAGDIVARLFAEDWPRDLLVNVNFPPLAPEAVKGVRVGRQGRRDTQIGVVEGVDPAGRPYLWIGDFLRHHSADEESDLGLVARGYVSVTPLHLDHTHHPGLERLRGLLG